MKKRSDRLGIVVDLAYQKECDKAKLLEQLAQQVNAAERQFDELNRYYLSYAQENNSETEEHSATMLQSRRFFLQHLHDAIEQQAEKVKNIKQQHEQVRAQWVLTHTKTENLKEFVSNCAKTESSLVEKQEQKVIDEWSTQRFNRNMD